MRSNSRRNGETVAGVELDNNTGSTKPEHNEYGQKIHRLEMSVHNGHVRVVTGAWLRDFSTSGLPVVGGINIRHFNNARPFWNK